MEERPTGELLPVGRGTVEAEPLTNAAGDHALLLRQAGQPRVLLLAEPGSVAETGRERVVVMPFDGDVETRIDGDALATWIATPYDDPSDPTDARVPSWASALGFVLIFVMFGLAVVGGAVVFSWILDAVGGVTVGPGDQRIALPAAGLLAMRIGLEFGGVDAFVDSLVRAVIDGEEGGATVVALLDRGDLSIHIPHRDGPAWNVVPLLHLHPGEQPSDDDWASANAILERLERYR